MLFNHRRSGVHKRAGVELVAAIRRTGGSQTAIMYGANLNYNATKEYLRLLSSVWLIGTDGGVDARPQYRPTEKGKEFLELFKRLETLVAGPT